MEPTNTNAAGPPRLFRARACSCSREATSRVSAASYASGWHQSGKSWDHRSHSNKIVSPAVRTLRCYRKLFTHQENTAMTSNPLNRREFLGRNSKLVGAAGLSSALGFE